MMIELDRSFASMLIEGFCAPQPMSTEKEVLYGEISMVDFQHALDLLMKLLESLHSDCIIMIYYHKDPIIAHAKFNYHIGTLFLSDIEKIREAIIKPFKDELNLYFFDLKNGGCIVASITGEEDDSTKYNFHISGWGTHGKIANKLEELEPSAIVYANALPSVDWAEVEQAKKVKRILMKLQKRKEDSRKKK